LPSGQRILIVSQTFPPYNGIGGRRWAKFAKYLHSRGVKLEVICADLDTEKNSPWSEDVRNIKVYPYRHHFPRVVEQFPNNLLEKISYRIQLEKLRRISRGTPYDRAIMDEVSFMEVFLDRLREFRPETVIVTGAPFYLLHFAIRLKSDYPETKFIADFRDPWTWGSSYGYAELPEVRLEYEKSLEVNVVSQYHAILSPWPSIVDKLKDLYPANASKIHLLEHGYDPDDFEKLPNQEPVKGYDLIFGGTIYQGMEKILEKVTNTFGNSFNLGVFSNDLAKLKSTDSKAELSGVIGSKDFLARVASSKTVLMLIPSHMKDGIPSKLFEYAYLGTPIIAIGVRGALSEFIEVNQFGCFLEDVSKLPETIENLSAIKKNEQVLLNYNFEHLTEKLLSFLKTG